MEEAAAESGPKIMDYGTLGLHTYASEGCEGEDVVIYQTVSDMFYAPENPYTCPGKTFKGWSYGDGNVEFQPGDMIFLYNGGSIALYPVFE